MLQKKFARTMHFVSENTKNQDRIKQLILDNLISEYAQNDQLNANLITAYTEHFLQQYNSQNAIRILREEVKQAVLKSRDEKSMLIQKLKQRIQKWRKEHEIKGNEFIKQEQSNQGMGKETNQQQQQKQSTIQSIVKNDNFINDEKRKSIYKVDGQLDEWGAIIRYNTLQYQKEIEEDKKKKIVSRQRIKEDLDKQIAEKEKNKLQEKKDDLLYFTSSLQQLKDYEKQQEQLYNSKRQQEMNEKKIRDQQVYLNKKQNKIQRQSRKEQNVFVKQQDEEMLLKIKEEIKAEDELNKRKKIEQIEKLQLILKQNEYQRIKTKEEIIRSKEQERNKQELFIVKESLHNNNRIERLRKEKEYIMNQNINNYSEQVIRQKKMNQEINQSLDDDYWPNNKNENQSNKREKQIQLFSDLEKQILEKKRRQTQEKSENRIIYECEQQEQRDYYKKEEERKNNIRTMYLKNAEELKKQIIYGLNGSPLKNKGSPVEKMGDQELLQNKKILKKIANESLLGIQVKKTEISFPE